MSRGNKKITPDFWLPLKEGTGICIFVSRSVIQATDAEKLRADVTAVQKAIGAIERVKSLIVINGYLAENLRKGLEGDFSSVLIYNTRSFTEDCDAALTGLRVQLEQSSREDALTTIQSRLEELSRQTNSSSEQIVAAIRHLPSDREVQSALAITLRTFFGQLVERETPSSSLPLQLRTTFDRGRECINPFSQMITGVFELMFGTGQFREFREVPRLGWRFADELISVMDPSIISIGFVLPLALDKFEQRISEILGNTATFEDRESLTSACRSFDAIAERALGSGKEPGTRSYLRLAELLTHELRGNGLVPIELTERTIDRAMHVIPSLGREVYETCREINRRII